jgi:lysyl-tRNA synthetase class 2
LDKTADLKKHLARIYLIDAIRRFFVNKGFLDVLTPPAVANPGMETHIHPFKLWKTKEKAPSELYLHTSPEFYLKELLSLGFEKIFSLSYVFRDEPESPHHRPQFIMLEWYRKNVSYEQLMTDCQDLINFCAEELNKKGIAATKKKIQKATVSEIFFQFLNLDILQYLDALALENLIKNHFPEIPLPKEKLSWEDLYFLLFLNKIESRLNTDWPWIIYEFPFPLKAYSTLKKQAPRVCQRFELFWKGLEIGNCFNELTDTKEQKIDLNSSPLKKRIFISTNYLFRSAL